MKELAVSGSDLIAIGIKPGKEIGEILNRLLEMVIEDPELNQKEILLEKSYNLKRDRLKFKVGVRGFFRKNPVPICIFSQLFS